MNVAVLSDVHGFSLALDRVLQDIASEGDIDTVIVAGDLVEGGPDPLGALTRLRESGAILLQGNTDRDAAANKRDGKSASWVRQQLSEENLRFLGELPFSHRVTPPGGTSPDDDLLVVHANPFDLDRAIKPDAGSHELTELLGDTRAAMIAFGHIHIAYIRELEHLTLVDVSATGNSKDGDIRSKWGRFHWDQEAGRWTAELRYVPYPLEETKAQFESTGHPNAESAFRKLEKASYDG